MSTSQLLAELEQWPTDWRKDWEIREHSMPMPQAWHRSGLCFYFEFEQLDEEGNWGWVVGDDDISISRLAELKLEMGCEVFSKWSAQLSRQAKACWHELGYNDWSLRRPPGDGA